MRQAEPDKRCAPAGATVRDLDMNLLPIFEALLGERNVSRAAERLDLSQSATSHALRRLRDFFNDPLLVKVGNHMRPTPLAETLQPTIAGLMARIRQDLLAAVHFDASDARRVFSFGLTDMGEVVFLPSLIDALRVRAPHCTLRSVQLGPLDLASALESGNIDLALGALRSTPELLYQQQLFSHPFVTIVSRRNGLVADTITPDLFYELEHVVVSPSNRADTYYDSDIDLLGRKRKIYMTTPHFSTVPVIIERHPQLIATVPRELAAMFSASRAVKVVPTPVPLPPVTLRQYWHPRFHHDEANIWLRALVKSIFEKFAE